MQAVRFELFLARNMYWDPLIQSIASYEYTHPQSDGIGFVMLGVFPVIDGTVGGRAMGNKDTWKQTRSIE